MNKIKWRRHPPFELRASVGDLQIRIWPNQNGFNQSLKTYSWQVVRDGKPLRAGIRDTQRAAKRDIARALNTE